MDDQTEAVTAAAQEQGFSGVVRIDDAGAVTELAFGLADRAHNLPNTAATRFGMASGTKTFTALAVLSLVADGTMGLDDPARRWLGADLPQIPDGVTVRRLLSHTSGVGEGIDDDAEVDVHILPGSPHSYEGPEDYLAVIDRPMLAEPGTEFCYNNSGFVLLGLLAQRASGIPYHDLVRQRVFEPAGLTRTDFLRSDDLPGDAAVGYLYPDASRTNLLHLPIVGAPDGGSYTTTADLRTFWTALAAGRIVPAALVELMGIRPAGTDPDDDDYGLGVWLPRPGVLQMVGADAGVSMVSEHDPAADFTMTVLSNDSDGAWAMWGVLRELTGTGRPDADDETAGEDSSDD